MRHFKALPALFLVVLLSGCSTISARQGDDLPQAKLREDNTSIVLLHTSLHDNCGLIEMTLAQRDAAGQWVRGDERMTIKGVIDAQKLPSQFVLPAGEYGIVRLMCRTGYPQRTYRVKQLTPGSVWDGSGATYDKPMATFKVLPGEVVDVGSLRLPITQMGQRYGGGATGEFVGVVTTIPEVYLQNLAAKNPDIYQRRVTRPMTAAIRI
jgi:hypothetical protein